MSWQDVDTEKIHRQKVTGRAAAYALVNEVTGMVSGIMINGRDFAELISR